MGWSSKEKKRSDPQVLITNGQALPHSLRNVFLSPCLAPGVSECVTRWTDGQFCKARCVRKKIAFFVLSLVREKLRSETWEEEKEKLKRAGKVRSEN